MRMRKKPNLIPRLERCAPVRIDDPAALAGHWRELMPAAAELHLELGCGKGKFTAELAAARPDVLLTAVERVPEALVMAMEKAMAQDLHNVRFISADVEHLTEFFAPGEVDCIYLNFCDPWPRKKHAGRRLTHRHFLEKYCQVLVPGGQLHFKTDNQDLFTFSLEEFAASGWTTEQVTRNLHENGPVGIMTGYEEKFYGQGVPICRCVARAPHREAEPGRQETEACAS